MPNIDILLTANGDLHISESGDISLTESIRQAVRIRLLWFFAEWRFAPELGVPYFEDILIKNPNPNRIRAIIRREAMSVQAVRDVLDIQANIDAQSRTARISFTAVTAEETYREELNIPWSSTD